VGSSGGGGSGSEFVVLGHYFLRALTSFPTAV